MHDLNTIQKMETLREDLAKARAAFRGQIAAENDAANWATKAAKYDLMAQLAKARGFNAPEKIFDEYDLLIGVRGAIV